MTKLVLFSFSIICLLTYSRDISGQITNLKKIRIDPAAALGGKASDLFETIQYIPLESTTKSLFGEVDKLLATDSSFVIFDFDTHSVLFFDLNGKFITRVTSKTKTYLDILLDQDKKQVGIQYFNDVTSNSVISHYSYKGKLLNHETLLLSKQATYTHSVSMGNGISARFNSALLVAGDPASDSTTHLITIERNSQLLHSFFPVTQKKNSGFCLVSGWIQPPKVIQNGGFYISTPLDYRLYHVTPTDTQFLFQFVFPVKRTLSKDIFNTTRNRYIDSVVKKIPDDESTIIDVSNIYFRNSKLYFKINVRAYTSHIGSESKFQYNFIYDTLSTQLISLERILPDEKSCFLPFWGNRMSVNGLEYNNDNFYTSISSLKMFTARDATKSRNPQYPPVLQEYFKTQSRKSNPVIVRMKLKE